MRLKSRLSSCQPWFLRAELGHFSRLWRWPSIQRNPRRRRLRTPQSLLVFESTQCLWGVWYKRKTKGWQKKSLLWAEFSLTHRCPKLSFVSSQVLGKRANRNMLWLVRLRQLSALFYHLNRQQVYCHIKILPSSCQILHFRVYMVYWPLALRLDFTHFNIDCDNYCTGNNDQLVS